MRPPPRAETLPEPESAIAQQIASLEAEIERVNALPNTSEQTRAHLNERLRQVKERAAQR